MIRETRPVHTIDPCPRTARGRLARGAGVLVLLAGLVLLLTPLASGAAQAAAPEAPTSLIVKSATFKSVTISWSAPQSPTRLRRYSVYKNGVRLTTTSALSHRGRAPVRPELQPRGRDYSTSQRRSFSDRVDDRVHEPMHGLTTPDRADWGGPDRCHDDERYRLVVEVGRQLWARRIRRLSQRRHGRDDRRS